MNKIKAFFEKSKVIVADIITRYFAMIIFIIGTVWILIETTFIYVFILYRMRQKDKEIKESKEQQQNQYEKAKKSIAIY